MWLYVTKNAPFSVCHLTKPTTVALFTQVVLAFHAGRLGASLSFMGKGVTYYSSLCLTHLTHEMTVIDPTQV